MPIQSYFQKLTRTCLKCGTNFLIKPSQLKVRGGGKYCSKSCFFNRTKLAKICEECGKAFSTSPSRTTIVCCSRECQYKRIKRKHLNINCDNCGKLFHRSKSQLWKTSCCSRKCMAEYQSKFPRRDITKEKNPSWKGGVTPQHVLVRTSAEYIRWRKSIFERDGYACVLCGTRGGELNADHIKSFSKHPELRFDINNGRTLCVDCHRKTENYGFKSV